MKPFVVFAVLLFGSLAIAVTVRAEPIATASGLVLGEPIEGAMWFDAGRMVTAEGCYDVSTSPPTLVGPSLALDGLLLVPDTFGALVGVGGSFAAGPAWPSMRAVRADVQGKDVTIFDVDCTAGSTAVATVDVSASVPPDAQWEHLVPTPIDSSGAVYLRYGDREDGAWKHGMLRVSPSGQSETVVAYDDLEDLLLFDLFNFRLRSVAPGAYLTPETYEVGGWKIRLAAVSPDDSLWMLVGWSTLARGSSGSQHSFTATWLVQRTPDGVLHVRSKPQAPANYPTVFHRLYDNNARNHLVYSEALEAFVLPPTIAVRGLSGAEVDRLSTRTMTLIPTSPAAADSWLSVIPSIDIQDVEATRVIGDTNGDLHLDAWPVAFDFALLDVDHDGLSHLAEEGLGTHPFLSDTDGDGVNDGAEALYTGSSPTSPDSDDPPDIIWAPSTFISDWDRIREVNHTTCGGCLRSISNFAPRLCYPFLGCFDADGEQVITSLPEGAPDNESLRLNLQNALKSATLGPGGDIGFAWVQRDVQDLNSPLVMVRFNVHTGERTELFDPDVHQFAYGIAPLPFDDDTVLGYRRIGALQVLRMGPDPHALIDLDRVDCPVKLTPDSPCEPRPELFRGRGGSIEYVGFDRDREAHWFELANLDGATTVVAVTRDDVTRVWGRQHLPLYARPSGMFSSPDGSLFVGVGAGWGGANGASMSASLKFSARPQAGARDVIGPWFRRGFFGFEIEGYVVQPPPASGGDGGCSEGGGVLVCSGGSGGGSRPTAFNYYFPLEFTPIPAAGPQPGELIVWSGEARTRGYGWFLWRVGNEGGTTLWLDGWQFAQLMEPGERDQIWDRPLGSIRDMAVAPDMSEICIVEPEEDRVWRVLLASDGTATSVQRVSAAPDAGGCAYDADGRLGIVASDGLTIDGAPTALATVDQAGPLLFADGRWIALQESGEEFDVTWGPALCMDAQGSVTESPTRISAAGPAPTGVVWLDGELFEYEYGMLSGEESRARGWIGTVDTLCLGEGKRELLVARRELATGPDPDISIWDWIYREQLLFIHHPFWAAADGGSIAMRADGITFLTPRNAHTAYERAGAVNIEVTPDLLFRLRPDFSPVDWNDRFEELDPLRRELPLTAIHYTDPDAVRAIALAPGGSHNDDYWRLGMEPAARVDVETPTEMEPDPEPESSESPKEGCCRQVSAGSRTPFAVLVGLMLLAIRRRRFGSA